MFRFGIRALASGQLFLLAGQAFAQSSTPPAPPVEPVAAEVWMVPGGFPERRQPDGNTVLLIGPGGIVVLDTGRHWWHRQVILDFARTKALPIVAIVNSHWHLDHVSGNPALKAAYPDAKVYASDALEAALTGFLADSTAAAREYLKTPELSPDTAEDVRNDLATIENGAALKPDVVVTETETLMLGGRSIKVHLSRNGPTAGDLWLFDQATHVAAVGDLVTLPVPFLDTACVAGWKAALGEIADTPFEILIPGHGAPMKRGQFEQYRSSFEHYIECANGRRPAADCAADWSRDAKDLLEANAMNPKQAERIASYYVSEVLRANGGNSKSCHPDQ